MLKEFRLAPLSSQRPDLIEIDGVRAEIHAPLPPLPPERFLTPTWLKSEDLYSEGGKRFGSTVFEQWVDESGEEHSEISSCELYDGENCLRGYMARWELKDGRFTLVGMQGRYRLRTGVPMFANWISGVIDVYGDLLEEKAKDGRHFWMREGFQVKLYRGMELERRRVERRVIDHPWKTFDPDGQGSFRFE